MSTRVSLATATLDDAGQMAAFLAAIPNGDQLGKVLERRQPLASRAYDDDSWTARFVASDGTWVKCFTVTDVTIDQAEMIAAACVDHGEWDEATFREAVKEALGPTLDWDDK